MVLAGEWIQLTGTRRLGGCLSKVTLTVHGSVEDCHLVLVTSEQLLLCCGFWGWYSRLEREKVETHNELAGSVTNLSQLPVPYIYSSEYLLLLPVRGYTFEHSKP